MGARKDQISAAINDAVRLMRAHKLAAIDFAAHVVDAVRDDLPALIPTRSTASALNGLQQGSKKRGKAAAPARVSDVKRHPEILPDG